MLGDAAGHDVDFHVVTLDAAGNGIYGPPDRNVFYPVESLAGRGVILLHAVQCISPEWLVNFHTGYAFDHEDIHDVIALHRRFGVPLPAEYAGYNTSHSLDADEGPRPKP